MSAEETFKNFGELSLYAAVHSQDEGDVNTFDAETYWKGMVEWAAGCAFKHMPPVVVMTMEAQIIQKQLLRDQGKPACAIDAGNYATRLHRIELLQTMMKNDGFAVSRATEVFVEAMIAPARPLKPVKPAEQTA